MRIGYDAKRLFHNASGLGNYSRDLVRILATQLPKSDFFLYNPKESKLNRWKPLSNTTEIKPHGFWRKLHSFWRQGPIVRQLNKDKVDLYHGLSGELPKGLQIPSVVTVHDLIFYRYPKLYKPIDVYIHKRKVNHAVRKATKVVAISEQTKKDLITFTGVAEDKITVIYQGCNRVFKKTVSKEERDKIKTKFGLPGQYVLYVGTLEARKNALLIAKALKDSTKHMVFVGKTKEHGEKLKAYIKQNDIQHRTTFIDDINIEELAGVYQGATVFCYPSFFEGFGIPIIEALYSGIPVITTKGGCFAEAGGPASFYIDPSDHNALKKVIDELFLEPKEVRAERIQQGLSFAQRFDDEPIAEQWENLYKSVLEDA